MENTDDRIQIMITIRFSIIIDTGNPWHQTKKQPLSERKKIIFDDQRLKTKFNFFENLTLPSLDYIKQEENFLLLLLTSEGLPDSYQQKLLYFAKNRKYIKICPLPVGGNFSEYLKYYHQMYLDKSAKTIASIRMDDDDALSGDFLVNLKKYLKEEFHNFCVSFPKGYLICFKNHQIFLKESYTPKIAVGLAYICSPENFIDIYHLGSHNFVDQRVPTILEAKHPMYLVSVNDGCDSGRQVTSGFDSVEPNFLSTNFPYINKNIFELFHPLHNITSRHNLLSRNYKYVSKKQEISLDDSERESCLKISILNPAGRYVNLFDNIVAHPASDTFKKYCELSGQRAVVLIEGTTSGEIRVSCFFMQYNEVERQSSIFQTINLHQETTSHYLEYAIDEDCITYKIALKFQGIEKAFVNITKFEISFCSY